MDLPITALEPNLISIPLVDKASGGLSLPPPPFNMDILEGLQQPLACGPQGWSRPLGDP
jgi:hypothetical protein